MARTTLKCIHTGTPTPCTAWNVCESAWGWHEGATKRERERRREVKRKCLQHTKKYETIALFYQAHINSQRRKRNGMEDGKKTDSEELKLVHFNLFFRVFLLRHHRRLAHAPVILSSFTLPPHTLAWLVPKKSGSSSVYYWRRCVAAKKKRHWREPGEGAVGWVCTSWDYGFNSVIL